MMDATHLKVHRTAASYRLPVDRQRVRHPLVSGRIEATEDLAASHMPFVMALDGR
jgi:hypothetical protein